MHKNSIYDQFLVEKRKTSSWILVIEMAISTDFVLECKIVIFEIYHTYVKYCNTVAPRNVGSIMTLQGDTGC